MQNRKSILALALSFAMILTAFVSVFSVSAADYSLVEDKTKAYEIDTGVKYTEYTITSGVNGHIEQATMLEFSPDTHIPMAFSCFSGTSATLDTQYDYAVNKYGYDVAAIMNGAFFSMDSGSPQYGNYGTLVGIVISNGKVASAHAGYSGEVIAFTSDGKMQAVNSSLSYTLSIDGKDIPNGIYYINKTSGSKIASAWKNNFYYYDLSCGSTVDTYEVCPGYEVICEKVDNTELIVGGTLRGKVVEVKTNSYASKLAANTYDMSNKFVLFLKSGSTYADYVKDLKEGAPIEIGVTETIEKSKEIMENASSVISNVGWLVKDGVDRTQIDATIGTHSVTLCARWNAIGTKADGSYVLFTTEGKGTGDTGAAVTLQDVARAMIDAGCTNVIRMDGGGSVAVYAKDDGTGNPGYKVASSRAVGDCILIVKRPQASEELKTVLNGLIAEADKALEASEDDVVKAIRDNAVAVRDSATSTSGDFTRVIMDLRSVFSGSLELTDAINKAKTINYADFSEAELKAIRDAYDYALAVKATENATAIAIKEAAAKLNEALSVSSNVALGKSYTLKGIHPNAQAPSWPDEDNCTLTDGKDATVVSYSDIAWVGFNKAADDIKNNVPPLSEIIVDLGASYSIDDIIVRVYDGYGDAGIKAPKGITFEYSADGESWTALGSGVLGIASTEACINYFELKTEAPVDAKFVKAIIEHDSGWAFVSEIEVNKAKEKVNGVGYIKGFNGKIGAGDAMIFTPDVVPELTLDASNVRWSQTLYLEWDEAKGGYKVVETKTPNGVDGRALKENEIAIGVHDAQTTPADSSTANRVYAMTAKVGDFIEFYGIYADIKDSYPGAYFKIVSAEDFNKEFSGKYTAKDYNIPTNGVKVLDGEVNLVPEGTYTIGEGGGQVATYEFTDGKLIVRSPGGWPNVSYVFPEPLCVDFDDSEIEIDFKVEGGYTAILLATADGQLIKIHQNVGADTAAFDSGSGDLGAGEYKAKLKLSEILANLDGGLFDTTALLADDNGNITFTQITVYATSGATVTVNSIKLNPNEGTSGGDTPDDDPGDTPVVPQPGDAGLIALAIISAIALGGAIVIGKRK